MLALPRRRIAGLLALLGVAVFVAAGTLLPFIKLGYANPSLTMWTAPHPRVRLQVLTWVGVILVIAVLAGVALARRSRPRAAFPAGALIGAGAVGLALQLRVVGFTGGDVPSWGWMGVSIGSALILGSGFVGATGPGSEGRRGASGSGWVALAGTVALVAAMFLPVAEFIYGADQVRTAEILDLDTPRRFPLQYAAFPAIVLVLVAGGTALIFRGREVLGAGLLIGTALPTLALVWGMKAGYESFRAGFWVALAGGVLLVLAAVLATRRGEGSGESGPEPAPA